MVGRIDADDTEHQFDVLVVEDDLIRTLRRPGNHDVDDAEDNNHDHDRDNYVGDEFPVHLVHPYRLSGVPSQTAASRAPAFSPHDLRHRRISRLHLGGVPWARIGEHVGQRNLAVTANTCSHVLADEAELDYDRMVAA